MKDTPRIRTLGAALLCLATASIAPAATIVVDTISELQSAINGADPGDIIIVENGTYTTSSAITVNRVGTASNPIIIAAESIGGVTITGSHGFTVNSPAAHVEIEGFRFTHTSGRNAINSGATFIRFTRNLFQCTGDGNYLVVAGHDAEIDRNEFRNKSTVGNMIDVRGSGSQIARRVWIHHNYFHDFSNAGANGAETLRFGLSGLSLSDGDGLIEHNLFVRCQGENELISIKSSTCTVRFNTILDSPGTQLTQRHGNDCLIYGNYLRNTDGIRIFGDRHQIFSNYLEGNTGGINIGNGGGEVADGDPLTSHDRPDNCIITFNTLINNTRNYYMTGRTNGLGAIGTVFANNIIQGGGPAADLDGPYTGATWSGNILWNTNGDGDMPSSGYTTVNPLLAADAQGVFHLQSGSPAINSATGSYSAVTIDMDGQPRSGTKDKGADEFSTAGITAKLLTPSDVGPNSGLNPPVAAPTFSPGGGSYSSAQNVTISTTTSGASIRYTTNGSTPTSTSGTVYTGPVTVSSSLTLRAIAYKSGSPDSSVSSATYTIGGGGGGTTIDNGDGWVNQALTSTQTGTFTAELDASSSVSPANAIIGLSSGAAAAYTDAAVMVRFNQNGTIDARNGGGFTTGTISFSAGVTYHFRLVVNVSSRTYSAFVTAPGGSEQTIGTNLAFRSEQSGVTSLSHSTYFVNASPGGSLTYGPVTIGGGGGGTPAKLTSSSTPVTASADDGNVPANTLDGSLSTRWSANGDGQWIRYDLGSAKTVSFVKIAFYNGNVRTSTFDVQVSNSTGGPWTTVASRTSSGSSTALETFDFTDAAGWRYVRILGHGNSVNLWNSYTEVEVWGF